MQATEEKLKVQSLNAGTRHSLNKETDKVATAREQPKNC
jgi:hypothetical protein